jgi:hypothetical protein
VIPVTVDVDDGSLSHVLDQTTPERAFLTNRLNPSIMGLDGAVETIGSEVTHGFATPPQLQDGFDDILLRIGWKVSPAIWSSSEFIRVNKPVSDIWVYSRKNR